MTEIYSLHHIRRNMSTWNRGCWIVPAIVNQHHPIDCCLLNILCSTQSLQSQYSNIFVLLLSAYHLNLTSWPWTPSCLAHWPCLWDVFWDEWGWRLPSDTTDAIYESLREAVRSEELCAITWPATAIKHGPFHFLLLPHAKCELGSCKLTLSLKGPS